MMKKTSTAVLVTLLASISLGSQTTGAVQDTPAPAAPVASATVTQTTNAPPEAGAPLRVMVGKSVLINTADRLRRVSVTDPAVADALVVTPNQVLVQGKSPGEVTLILWDEREHSRSFDLRVDVDITAAAEEVKRIFVGEPIEVSASRSAIVLNGHVTSKNVSERAALIASAYAKNVVNVMTFGPQGAQEVLLEVKFAEVDRTQLLQAGSTIFSTGATNTLGVAGTNQFPGIGPPVQINDRFPGSPSGASPFGSQLQASDLLNVFLFRPDIHLGLLIKALQQKNVLQILAEPNLIAVNGKESSFLAGGEFPIPIVQSGGGFNSVTVQFKEFGVRLKFTPEIMPNGNIHLRVAPEVSALDFANAVTISGFVIPALSTRRADTEFELQDGQSFVIAGLMDHRLTDIKGKVPGLGNLPIIGYLFRSKNAQKSNTELMVLCTAKKIVPTTAAPPLPKTVEPFLDQNKFDPKGGGRP